MTAEHFILTCVLLKQWLSLLFINQELECAVSVEEDNRQEWTFTLYDFDNNGKVTREVKRLRPMRSKDSDGCLLSVTQH